MSKHSIEAANRLNEIFEKSTQSPNVYGRRQHAFVSQGGEDKNGTRYGSYKTVFRDELENREYIVQFLDPKQPAIFYTDVFYDPKVSKYVKK